MSLRHPVSPTPHFLVSMCHFIYVHICLYIYLCIYTHMCLDIHAPHHICLYIYNPIGITHASLFGEHVSHVYVRILIYGFICFYVYILVYAYIYICLTSFVPLHIRSY